MIEHNESQPFLEPMYVVDDRVLEEDNFSQKVLLQNVVLFVYAHCLHSFVDMIDILINENGIRRENIFVLPKSYSVIPNAVEKLRKMNVNILDYNYEFKVGHFDLATETNIRKNCEKIYRYCNQKTQHNKKNSSIRLVLVDDGGLLTRFWHQKYKDKLEFEVVSVQQTASGMHEEPFVSNIPKINVARCAAKRHFESAIIASGVTRKASELKLFDSRRTVGVCGYGAVGKALVRKLSELGCRIILHDIEGLPSSFKKDVQVTTNQRTFLHHADIVFGCVGRNWILAENVDLITGDNVFVSCSSRDVEFKNILRHFHWVSVCAGQFPDLETHIRGTIRIMNSGFPINFDRETEYETKEEISITRALVQAAILQSLCLNITKYKRPVMLSTVAQKRIVQTWLEEKGDIDNLSKFGVSITDFEDREWWSEQSGGEEYTE